MCNGVARKGKGKREEYRGKRGETCLGGQGRGSLGKLGEGKRGEVCFGEVEVGGGAEANRKRKRGETSVLGEKWKGGEMEEERRGKCSDGGQVEGRKERLGRGKRGEVCDGKTLYRRWIGEGKHK